MTSPAEPGGQRAGRGPGAGEGPGAAGGFRLVAPGLRWLLVTAAVLVGLAGIQLLVFTAHTGQYFAFTITSPLAAAFLGAGYWAAVPIEALAARQRHWANARIAVPAVLTFTVLTLAVTLTHLRQLHLGPRYPHQFHWRTTTAIAYLTLLATMLLTGTAILAQGRPRTPAASDQA